MKLQTILKFKGYKAFNMEQLNNGHHAIEVELNGRTGRFIVDTGATHNCIAKEDCSYFKVLMWGDVNAKSVGSDRLSKMSFGNSVAFKNSRIDEVKFVVIDLRNVNKSLNQSEDGVVNGIIGMELLRSVNALVDCANSILYIKK